MSSATTRIPLLIGLAALMGSCIIDSASASDPNTLTEEEKRAGFELLFNGRDLRGWEPAHGPRELKDGPWKVQDGAICFLVDKSAFPALACWRVRIPPDFDLRFEWKEVANEWPFEGHFSLGTSGVADKIGWKGNFYCDYFAAERSIGIATYEASLPVRFGNKNWSETPSKDARRPAGQWNEARMVYKGSVFQNWLNGEKILEVDLRDERWLKLENVAGRPLLDQWFKVKPNGFRFEISNSDVPAWFRNIKVRAIPAGEKLGS